MLLSLLLSSSLTFVELNCENLFDYHHDEGKEDTEFTPTGARRWTRTRYWRKLNALVVVEMDVCTYEEACLLIGARARPGKALGFKDREEIFGQSVVIWVSTS